MMRVAGKVGFVAVALSLVATASAYAIPSRGMLTDQMTTAAVPGGGASIGTRTFMSTGFEAAEGFAIGTISGQTAAGGKWNCQGSANAIPPGPGCAATQVLTSAATDPNAALNAGGIVGKGNGSAQSLFMTKNWNFPGATLRGVRTPTITDFTQSTLNFDYRMDDAGGASYLIIPQAPTQAKRITNIYFYYTGYTYILDDADGHGPGTGLTYRNVGSFNYDQWTTMQMVLNQPARTFTLGAGSDKDHLAPLCYTPVGSGPVCTFDLGATLAVGLGDQFEEVVFLDDNFQNTGLGEISGDGRGPGLYIDNIQLKPEPGSIALLAAGALLALRRKVAR